MRTRDIRIRGILIVALLVAAAALPAPASAASRPGSTNAPGHSTITPDRSKGLPIPYCPQCRRMGCHPVCQGSGTTTKCWWSCPKSQ
jgi:hypothetical protein